MSKLNKIYINFIEYKTLTHLDVAVLFFLRIGTVFEQPSGDG